MPTSEKLVFDKAADEWLDSLKSELRETSIARYKFLLETKVYPYFKGAEIDRITRRDVEYILSELLEYGGKDKTGLAPKTVIYVLSVIKNTLNYASIRYKVNTPNLSDIRIKQTPGKMRLFTVPEQIKIDRYLKYEQTPANLGMLVCSNTGLRIGEICALRWENIHISKKYIAVKEIAQRVEQPSIRGKKTKTKTIALETDSYCTKRKVPISDELAEILQKNRCPNNAYLLTGTTDMMDPRTLQSRFKKMLDLLEIPDASFQTFRNTFATRCIEEGISIKSLSEMLGHANVNVTMDRYVHPSIEDKVKDMNMLSGILAAK